MASNKSTTKKPANSNSRKTSPNSAKSPKNSSQINRKAASSKVNSKSKSTSSKGQNITADKSTQIAKKEPAANLLPMVMPSKERSLTKVEEDINMALNDCADSTMYNTCRMIDNTQYTMENNQNYYRELLENRLDYFNRLSDIISESFNCRSGEDFIDLNEKLARTNIRSNYELMQNTHKLAEKSFRHNISIFGGMLERSLKAIYH